MEPLFLGHGRADISEVFAIEKVGPTAPKMVTFWGCLKRAWDLAIEVFQQPKMGTWGFGCKIIGFRHESGETNNCSWGSTKNSSRL
jgi:hypothetical protein